MGYEVVMPPSRRPQGRVAQFQFEMACSDPLPPSAALPLREGENKAFTLQAVISPS
jgi:hypothetical protein